MAVISLPQTLKMQKRKAPYIVFIALAVASLLMAGLPSPVLADANSTIVGTLEVNASVENIAVYANFSGDDNTNNSAVLEYRPSGGSWITITPFTVDRRSQWCYYNGDLHETVWVDNIWANQYRAIIFWLTPNTEYEVRVTFSDADGVSGTNPVSGSVTTMREDPISAGSTYYVAKTGNDTMGDGSSGNPWLTIQHAVDNISAGDTIKVRSGTYAEEVEIFNFDGTNDNWTILEANDPDNKPTIDGESTRGHNIRIYDCDYLAIRNINCQDPDVDGDGRNILIDHNSNYTIIDSCALDEPGSAWASSGVLIRDGIDHGEPCTHGIIKNCAMTCNDTRTQKFGVFFWGNHTNWSIYDCTINGEGFKDGIGGSGYQEMYCHDNVFRNPWDDGIEIEGENVNVALWGNKTFNTRTDAFQYMAVGMAPISVGPYYLFRNLFAGYSDCGLKIGNSSQAYCYLYHNTIYTTTYSEGLGAYGNNNLVNNIIGRNNIIYVGKYVIDSSAQETGWNTGWDFNYNDMLSMSDTHFSKWDCTADNRQQNWEEYKAATGFDANGISADPLFLDTTVEDYSLQSSSPCRDVGVVLPGFNDADSPWPYQGSAPDIGTYEFTSGASPGPLHHITITPASVTLEVGLTQQFTATGYDQNNNVINGISFTWSVVDPDAGSIDGTAEFTAGTVTGTYTDVVKAEADSTAGFASVSITVNPPNNAPVAEDDAYSVEENTTLNVAAPGVLANDSDVDGDLLTAVLVSDVSNGSLTLNADGSFSYTPAPDYSGSDGFTYVANDGTDDSNIASVSIAVTGLTATFGLNSGDRTYEDGADWLEAMRFQCPENGSVIKLELLFYDDSPHGNVRMGVYEDDNGAPGNLLLDAGTTVVADGWVEISGLSLAVTQNTYYWLSFCMSDQNGIRYQSGQVADSLVWKTHSYGPFPDPFGDLDGADNIQYVMRATYTVEEDLNKPGDANGDGNVDGLDITKVERIIMGLDDPTPGADANGDDNINTLDITQIELIIMGS